MHCVKSVQIRIYSWSVFSCIRKMERFVIIVNGFEPLTIITKRSILRIQEDTDQK